MYSDFWIPEPFKSLETIELEPAQRLTETRLRIQIPRQYHSEPVISFLASNHHLEVTILAALLSANCKESGWFDLQLRGTTQQIDSALIYLSDLNVKFWLTSDAEVDGW
jgi:ABC-type methionine transport system ATPase subunit